MARQDLKLDDTGDILIQNGDFVISESDEQHVQDNVDAQKGWFRESAHLGCAIWNKLNGTIDRAYIQTIRVNLEADGYNVKTVSIDDSGKLNIQTTN